MLNFDSEAIVHSNDGIGEPEWQRKEKLYHQVCLKIKITTFFYN